MEEKIKDIMFRRGTLHVINGNRFYSEESVKNCLQEAFGVLPQANVIKSVYCDCEKPMNGIDDKGTKYCKWCDRDFEKQ